MGGSCRGGKGRGRLGGCLAAVLIWPAMGLGPAAPVDAKDITVAVTQLTPHLDPMGANSNVNERVSENVVENLVRLDRATGEVGPGLATSWRMIDDRTLELDIRRNVRCHNGEAFDADDVAYMFGPARYNGADAPGYLVARQFLGTLETVQAIDTHSVRIRTRIPDPLLIKRLAGWMGQVPCADAFKAAPSWETWGRSVIGTGPYRIAQVRACDFQRFEAFPDYWGETPQASSFTLKVVPETAARLAGLIAGEFDVITESRPTSLQRSRRPASTLSAARSRTYACCLSIPATPVCGTPACGGP